MDALKILYLLHFNYLKKLIKDEKHDLLNTFFFICTDREDQMMIWIFSHRWGRGFYSLISTKKFLFPTLICGIMVRYKILVNSNRTSLCDKFETELFCHNDR